MRTNSRRHVLRLKRNSPLRGLLPLSTTPPVALAPHPPLQRTGFRSFSTCLALGRTYMSMKRRLSISGTFCSTTGKGASGRWVVMSCSRKRRGRCRANSEILYALIKFPPLRLHYEDEGWVAFKELMPSLSSAELDSVRLIFINNITTSRK